MSCDTLNTYKLHFYGRNGLPYMCDSNPYRVGQKSFSALVCVVCSCFDECCHDSSFQAPLCVAAPKDQLLLSKARCVCWCRKQFWHVPGLLKEIQVTQSSYFVFSSVSTGYYTDVTWVVISDKLCNISPPSNILFPLKGSFTGITFSDWCYRGSEYFSFSFLLFHQLKKVKNLSL